MSPHPRLVTTLPQLPPHAVQRVVLLESRLSASGPTYYPRASAQLQV
jgi:hypothetical protein